MALPDVPQQVLLDALSRFDQEYRATEEWLAWEQMQVHKYAIEHDGRRYPVKQIVSLATGVPTSGFSGGDEANGYVTKRGLKVVSLRDEREPNVWWVNQGKSYDEARAGGYISAPVADKGGGAPVHWKTMTEVRVGDLIVHNDGGLIRAIGRAASEAYLVPRPVENSGSVSPSQEPALRRVDVEYFDFDPALSVSSIADGVHALNISGGPFRRDGKLKQGYLYGFDIAGLQVLREASSAEWPKYADAVLPETTDRHVVKIAPGEKASEWDDCLTHAYICVGWDEMGDLRQYPTKDDFRTAFEDRFAEGYNHNRAQTAKKANELWTLRELRPGDRVVANKGISRVLAVGEVAEPGYEWRPDRSEMKHTVRVKWDTAFAKSIPAQRGWAFTTVEPISPSLYRVIVGHSKSVGNEDSGRFESLIRALEDAGLNYTAELVSNYLLALQTKRFVLLTGISGTGKTQLALAVARHFRQTVMVTEATRVPEDALDVAVLPYMLKYRRMVLPASFTASLVLPLAGQDRDARQIRVSYPEGEQLLTLSRDPNRNVTELLFKGAFREWFLAKFAEGDRFLVEAVDAGDGHHHGLRIDVPNVEERSRLLDNHLVTAVRPDWTDNRGLLGYYNPLTSSYTVTPFLRMLLDAEREVELAAQEGGREPAPFFAIFDEMNLARVEHYFSDFLSALESGEPIELHGDPVIESGETGDALPVPRQLRVPPNVFFIGTVNVDETTYMFSPKVLDRAFTIELNRVDLEEYGTGTTGEDTASDAFRLERFTGALGPARRPSAADWDRFGLLLGGELRQLVIDLHGLLAEEGHHFGYRVANEIARFVVLAADQTEGTPQDLQASLDIALLEKVLPKFHGTQQELGAVLARLFAFAVSGADVPNAKADGLDQAWGLKQGFLVPSATASETAGAPILPRTAAKTWAMLRRLRQQGFTSFIG